MKRSTSLSLLLLSAITAIPFIAASEEDPIEKVAPAEESTDWSKIKLPFDLYRLPVAPEASAAQQILTCNDLEREISQLIPLTYSYQPGFYEDPYQGAAVTIGTTMFMPAYFVSGFISFLEFREKGRIISAENKIELLRHLKAEQHCFES